MDRSAKKLLSVLIRDLVPGGIGVEIGVQAGNTSKHLLKNTNISHLYMIDPWKRDYSSQEKLYSTRDDPEEDYKRVKKTFAEYAARSTIIRKRSEDSIDDVPGELDFIFIDGNHEYDYVMKDLVLWVPKVRSGGLVAGHDWHSNFQGVVNAVKDFCKTGAFVSPLELEGRYEHHIPAPTEESVVMKSWPRGHLWWSIKK